MGTTLSIPFRPKQNRDAASQRFEDMNTNYQVSYHLLSELVKSRNTRHLLAKLEGEEAQSMVDFLNRVLERKDFPGLTARKDVLHTLTSLARAANIFPICLKLKGVGCKFDSPVNHGSFADIYKGEFDGQPICVKAIRKSQSNHTPEELLRILAKEAIISAHMSHQNVIPFYGVFIEQEKFCIITPWMEGGDLSVYLQKYPEIPRTPLMFDIISGLDYIHQLDIVHSDLKAKNVLVSRDSVDGRAVLADFGASRLTTATKTQSAIGEANWLSPELLSGKQTNPDQKSDIWSYACTCYEILAGIKPFRHVRDLHAYFSNGGPIPTRPVVGFHIDDKVWKIVEACWSKDPGNRPTATEICQSFVKLNLKDDRQKYDSCDSRVRIDRTEIDDTRVYKTLQKVQQMAVSSQGGKRG